MGERLTFKAVLHRGALLAAANWHVLVIQFIAESLLKILLAVPIVGGVLLVTLLVGRGVFVDLIENGLRSTLTTVVAALGSEPIALVAFFVAFAIVLIGGSALTFLVKGGTVTVLVDADRTVGPIERDTLRVATVRAASRFSIERFKDGCEQCIRRYFVLGLILIAVYAVSAVAYLVAVYEAYALVGGDRLLGWSMMAAICSTLLVVWISGVNLFYLLVQIAIAVDNRGVRASIQHVRRFLRAERRDVAGVFIVVLLLVGVATAAAFTASSGLFFISFVPFVGLAVLPLQAAMWLLRNLIFQYLGLTALAAYLRLYRSSVEHA